MTTKPTLSGFNKLAEVMIETYEPYLPTAFDESMTLLEKVNKVVEFVNQLNQINTDVVTQWNEVMEWVTNEGIDESVVAKLDEMSTDGTLSQIINVGVVGTLSNLTTSNKTDLVSAINENVARLADIAINVKSFGAKGDGLTDDTQAIKNVLANHKNVYFPPGEYVINIQNLNRNALHWFTNQKGISIKGNNATILDKSSYAQETLVNIFGFTNCSDIVIDLNYKGLPVSDPNTELSRLGCSFLYFETNCKNIDIKTKLENCRYGVRSGDYLNPVYGYCENFNINLEAKMIGYPIALYLSNNVKANLKTDGTVRSTYLAGVENANIKVSSKNYYTTAIQNLMTNSVTTYNTVQSEQRARGCSNINLDVTDEGSTQFIDYSVLIGLALQWVAQGTEYNDITAKYYVKSSDTLSTKVGGFMLSSTAKDTRTEYLFNWEPYIKIKNLKITGIIDRTGQTKATNSSGELFIKAFDDADTTFVHCPEITNLTLENTVFMKGSVQSQPLYVAVPNLKDVIQISGLVANGINMLANAQNGKVMVSNSVLQTLSVINSINHLALKDSTITGIDFAKVTKLTNSHFDFSQTNSHNGFRQLSTIANGNASYTFSNAIKSNALTKAIIVLIAGYVQSGTMKIGNLTDPVFFGSIPLNNTSGYTKFVPFYYTADRFPLMKAESIKVTFEGFTTAPNGQEIKVFIYEEEFN